MLPLIVHIRIGMSSGVNEAARARELAKQGTREALLDAAMAEFAEKGLDAPSLDAICARAGFTRGAFYVHFRDREDLVAAVMERVLGAFLDAVVAQGTSERDLDATVERFAAAFTALRASGPGSPPDPSRAWGARGVPFHQVLAACQRSPELRRRFVSILEEAIRRVTRAAERQGREHPEAVATLLVLTALGVRSALDLDLRFDETGVRDAALRLLRATETSGS
jgi:TetR/AcrR family transcriptional regulator, transcriptional repressor for nem operon